MHRRFLLPVIAAVVSAQLGSDASIRRFESLIKAGRYREVVPELKEFTSREARSPQAWYQLGYVYFRLHQTWDSVKALSRSLSIDPSQPEAHKILGHDFLILGRLRRTCRKPLNWIRTM